VELGAVEVVDAFRAVTWWRSLHARPLSLVAAGLRYHVDKEGARIGDRIDVAQRLKRRQTIMGKLAQEPKMQVTQMQDIGGRPSRSCELGYQWSTRASPVLRRRPRRTPSKGGPSGGLRPTRVRRDSQQTTVLS
jgi:hypothetical protein